LLDMIRGLSKPAGEQELQMLGFESRGEALDVFAVAGSLEKEHKGPEQLADVSHSVLART
jgi:hypothetical protein